MIRPRSGASLGLAVACLLAVGAGCAGHGSVYLIPLNPRKLNTTEQLVYQVTPRRCYYWIDESRLYIAMSDFHWSPLGEMHEREFALSFVLDGLPAGGARMYQANRRTMRLRSRDGLSNLRSASVAGLLTVWDFNQRRLHGRFRLIARKQSYFVLSGWGRSAPALVVGEFTAVEDRAAGEAILARTEQDALKRFPEASQQPLAATR
jgi:hypothetical protein